MNEPTEGHSHAYERIKAKKSLADILQVATSFEKAAFDFYTALIPRVSKQIRYLVEQLAAEEQRHHELFNTLAKDPDAQQQIQQTIATPVADHQFSDMVHLPELGENPDDQAILQYALQREDAAMKQYRELAENTEPGPIHDLFAFLANEEAQHKLELEKVYYQSIFRSNVNEG